jgi:hypothetical protein
MKKKNYPWVEAELKNIEECNKDKSLKERKKKMLKDYAKLGYCSRDFWSFDMTVAIWLLPRLKHFSEIYKGSSIKKSDFAAMIYSFEKIAAFEHTYVKPAEQKKIHKGLRLFADCLIGMWY